MRECPCVVLPPSFTQRERVPQLAGAQLPTQTPLQRGDPTSSWYDAATVVNLFATLNDFLKG